MNIAGQASSAPVDQAAADRHITSDPVDIDPPLAQRTCGRCRKLFDGDPTLYASAMPEWWACDPCRASLRLPPSSLGHSADAQELAAATAVCCRPTTAAGR
jgi:hypothetical protein